MSLNASLIGQWSGKRRRSNDHRTGASHWPAGPAVPICGHARPVEWTNARYPASCVYLTRPRPKRYGAHCGIRHGARSLQLLRQARKVFERLRGRAGVAQRKRRMDRTHWLCEHCLAQNKITQATVVNHKTPLAHGGSDDDDNTENLCRKHDLEVTAKQFGLRKPRPTTGNDGWPLD